MISTRDPYDGIVLRSLAKYGEPFQIADLGDKAGHFCLNEDAFLLVKYAARNQSPWQFTFHPDDINTLVDDYKEGGLFGGSYVCLVCGYDSLCALQETEWSSLLDFDATRQQTFTVRRDPRSSFEVTGSFGELNQKIPASRFPSLVFE
ncbi:hypothetical protein GGP85_002871 [Salinibacter ruber]|uniref:hypothetical protein n=1 Tax=Salinibacter ruber TaxID=146919 RepID=UPI0021688207|nr:hypothetical protein [Salinibacter ruber]MCS3827401.1 hypothetical protein [Salinibacter ruber]MCS4201537.1 hypothetical protein [Salinibacter ruber]